MLNNNKFAMPDRKLKACFSLKPIVTPIKSRFLYSQVHLYRVGSLFKAVNRGNVDVRVVCTPANRKGYRVTYLWLFAVNVIDFFL